MEKQVYKLKKKTQMERLKWSELASVLKQQLLKNSMN